MCSKSSFPCPWPLTKYCWESTVALSTLRPSCQNLWDSFSTSSAIVKEQTEALLKNLIIFIFFSPLCFLKTTCSIFRGHLKITFLILDVLIFSLEWKNSMHYANGLYVCLCFGLHYQIKLSELNLIVFTFSFIFWCVCAKSVPKKSSWEHKRFILFFFFWMCSCLVFFPLFIWNDVCYF